MFKLGFKSTRFFLSSAALGLAASTASLATAA